MSVAALRLAVALLASGGLAGCAAEGSTGGDRTFRDEGVPFTFTHPPSFTDEDVDLANSRGDVVAVRALDKVDVIAVRRLPAGARARTVRLRVLGEDVTSEVVPVPGQPGWGLECQYVDARRDEVLDACRQARRTIEDR